MPREAGAAAKVAAREAGAGPKVSLGDVASRLLGYSLPESSTAAPILAKRTSAVRKLDESKREEQEAQAVARAKKLLATQGHLTLRDKQGQVSSIDASSAVLEKSLRKIATRGVVQLFNAVRTAQKGNPEEKKAVKRQRRATGAGMDDVAQSAPLDLSRDSFLDILRRGSQPATKSDGKRPGAAFLQDDFMLGDNKAKHWGKPMDEEEEEEEEEGGDPNDDEDDDDDDEP
jgi:hypothetical protein